jgi:hypothetical protein
MTYEVRKFGVRVRRIARGKPVRQVTHTYVDLAS